VDLNTASVPLLGLALSQTVLSVVAGAILMARLHQ
jgi:hypothetical protein